jgi:hypothetical protein
MLVAARPIAGAVIKFHLGIFDLISAVLPSFYLFWVIENPKLNFTCPPIHLADHEYPALRDPAAVHDVQAPVHPEGDGS